MNQGERGILSQHPRQRAQRRTPFDKTTFSIEITAEQEAALDLMIRAEQISSKQAALHEAFQYGLHEMLKDAPHYEWQVEWIRKHERQDVIKKYSESREIDRLFERDRSPMREIDFD
jgi:hypothetical protein